MIIIYFAYLNAVIAAFNGYLFLAYDNNVSGAFALFSSLVAVILAATYES